jgi:hypothetical protein
MNVEQSRSFLSADAEVQLDQLLASWRQTRRLSSAQADKVRQAILEATTDLPLDWWRNYANRMNMMMAEVVKRTNTPRINFGARSWPVAAAY